MQLSKAIGRVFSRSVKLSSYIYPGSTPGLHTSNVIQSGEPARQVTKFMEVANRFVIGQGQDSEIVDCDEEPHMIPMPYTPGYVAFQLHERVNDFEIVRKLGWGTASSVWLGRLCDKSTEDSEFVAIKALSCYHSTEALTGRGGCYELDALEALGKINHPGKRYCVTMLEFFLVHGPHGSNVCITFKPQAVSLQEFMSQLRKSLPHFRWSIVAVKNLIKQVLMGLDCLHSVDFVHTDIKVSNVYLGMENEDKAIQEFLKIDPSQAYPPRRFLKFSPDPTVTIKSQPMLPFKKWDYREMPYRLADFGEAIPVDKISENTIKMPMAIRAPEIILGYPWGKAVDIWAVGCLALEVALSRRLFNLDAPPNMNFTEVYLSRIEELLGPFPSSFLDKCTRRDKYFDENGKLRKSLNFQDGNAHPMGDLKYSVSLSRAEGQEVELLTNFIKRCLSVDPSLRPSAAELLNDPWFTAEHS